MNTENIIPPIHLRDYAESRGWILLNEAIKDRLYVLTHPLFPGRQLVFPIDAAAPDYKEAATLVLEKLVDMENRSPLERVRNQDSD